MKMKTPKILVAALLALASFANSGTASANEWANAWAPASGTPTASNTVLLTTNGADNVNNSGVGAVIVIDVTAIAGGAPSVVFKIQVKDPASGKYVDMTGAATTAFAATGTQMLVIHHGITVGANTAIATVMPLLWRVVCTYGGTTTSITFTAGVSYTTT